MTSNFLDKYFCSNDDMTWHDKYMKMFNILKVKYTDKQYIFNLNV